MKRKELIKKYIEFFKSKNHKEIANSPLIPENDPTVLFTTAGMHPLVPYLLGQSHPLGKRLVNVQRCIRTGDIEEVGDATHHTFLEMLGNWSLGDYFKIDSIRYSFEFLTKVLKIPAKKLTITCFKGDADAPKDTEAAGAWEGLGIPSKQVSFLPKKDNWWGPAGATGPCGPDTEIFINDVEIWNNVFMQYNKNEKGIYHLAEQKNVDTGMGVERTIAILNSLDDNYLSEIWKPVIKQIEKISKKKYADKENQKAMRIIADHIKAAVFIIGDGISPANTEQGYVLRRLIRRAIRYGRGLDMEGFTSKIAEPIFKIYPEYPSLIKNKEKILKELIAEEVKFNSTLEKGMNVFEKLSEGKQDIGCEDAFLLYQSYGFPIEMTIELAKEKGIKVDEAGFKKQCTRHQELSRTAAAGRFKSGLADQSKETTKLHTAAHLLLQALKVILKDENISQKGSNITPERLRLDFNFSRKLTPKEIQDVEDLVNAEIEASSDVVREETSPEEAKAKGAQGSFDRKYGNIVSVYNIGEFSKEICAGPHVSNTGELGKFEIQKEESSSAGVRRIKGVLK